MKFRQILAPGKPGHDLYGALIVQARLLVFDVDAIVLFFLYFGLFALPVCLVTVKSVKVVWADNCPYIRRIDQIVVKIPLKTTVFILPRVLADHSLNRILVNILNDSENLVGVIDRSALEAALEEAADALVFFVVPVHKAGDDMLKDPAQRHIAGFNDQVNVVGHQAVGKDLKVADGLIFTQNRQKLAVIIVICKNLLLVDASINNVINVEGTFFTLRS